MFQFNFLFKKGDSYGPSPVSGGAPSPPLMIEDPGRPPSGTMGRRSEPFGQLLSFIILFILLFGVHFSFFTII